MSRSEERLEGGMKYLKSYRDGKGRWRRFPFYFTLSALVEIPDTLTRQEIQYVAPGLERLLKRKERDDIYDQRRRKIAEQLLGSRY